MKTPQVYALVDPDTFAIMYIGNTVVPFKVRLGQHKYGGTNRNTRKWAKSLTDQGKEPHIILLDPDGGKEKEHWWINFARDCGYPLLNYHPVRVKAEERRRLEKLAGAAAAKS